MPSRFALFLTALVLGVLTQAQASPAAPLTIPVPAAYKVTETLQADVNHDGQPDTILLVKGQDPTKTVKDQFGAVVDRNRRGLVVALKASTGYNVVLQHLDCFSSENEDGGVYMPPELSLEAKRGNLVISFLHGRYGHWRYTFRYEASGFRLIGYDRSNNHGPVVQDTLSINLLTNKVERKVNTNPDADGSDERFKTTWSRVRRPKAIDLSSIQDFDSYSIVDALGIDK